MTTCFLMQLFCHLCVLFATPWCLGKCFGQTGSRLCNSSGERPAPLFFLNATSFQEGDWVNMRCLYSFDLLTSNVFFCKNGHLLSQLQATLQRGTYTLSLQISQQSGGQYSCGYEQLGKEKKSALSSSRSLIVMPGHTDQSRSKEANDPTVQIRPIVVGIVSFTILFLVSLFLFLVKKAESHQRSSREEDVVKAIGDTGSDEVKYTRIARFSTKKHPPSNDTEEVYVAMAAVVNEPNSNTIPVSEISVVPHEDMLE